MGKKRRTKMTILIIIAGIVGILLIIFTAIVVQDQADYKRKDAEMKAKYQDYLDHHDHT